MIMDEDDEEVQFDLVLHSVPPSCEAGPEEAVQYPDALVTRGHIQAVALVRRMSGLSLRETVDLIKKLPAVLRTGTYKEIEWRSVSLLHAGCGIEMRMKD